LLLSRSVRFGKADTLQLFCVCSLLFVILYGVFSRLARTAQPTSPVSEYLYNVHYRYRPTFACLLMDIGIQVCCDVLFICTPLLDDDFVHCCLTMMTISCYFSMMYFTRRRLSVAFQCVRVSDGAGAVACVDDSVSSRVRPHCVPLSS